MLQAHNLLPRQIVQELQPNIYDNISTSSPTSQDLTYK